MRIQTWFSRQRRLWFLAGLSLLCSIITARAQNREIIQDPHFERGFILWQPQPGSHVRYGQISGFDATAAPIWGLCQWSSKFPLAAEGITNAGFLLCTNSAKAVTLGAAGSDSADLAFAVNTGVEYPHARKSSAEPWVHLLAEQEFDPPVKLENLKGVNFHVEARLLRSQLLDAANYSPAIHAAQFQIYFTLQNRNRQSAGYGDLLWFGIPIYDNRARFTQAFKEQDFGGTAKFIFTPDARVFTGASAQDGRWITIDKDLLPLMLEALETAWSRGFLKDSKNLSDYAIGGLNLGWEVPGTFDVALQIRDLSLKSVPKKSALKHRVNSAIDAPSQLATVPRDSNKK
jgi:hypothetical protein